MRRSKFFSLFTISGVPYLLPFGQGIADLKRGVQINGTGAYLWELLEQDRTEEELFSLFAGHYELSEPELPQARADLKQFLLLLERHDILERPNIQEHMGIQEHPDTWKYPDIPAASGSDTVLGASTDTVSWSNSVPGQSCGSHSGHKAGTPVSVSAAEARRQDDAPDPDTELRRQDDAPGQDTETVQHDPVRHTLSIGGLILLLCGPEEAFTADFDAFETLSPRGNSLHADQTVIVTEHIPAQRPQSKLLLKNHELIVMESASLYILLFPAAPGIREVHLTKDGCRALYYCCPPYTDSFRQDLFHAIRLSFLYLAQRHNMAALHSASLLYQGRAWLFSGHSGAGKSTHTNLWKELYSVPLINGDINLLSAEGGHPVIHGIPWCGTSGITDSHSYPLGGILLVKKSQQNYTDIPDHSHAQLLVAQRLISPGWTEALMRKNLSLVESLVPHILVCRLHCTKSPEAVETAKQTIDAYLAPPSSPHSLP